MDVPEGAAISSLQSLVLDLPPSCIEFCPAHPDYFAVGTYYLEKTADAPGEDAQPAGDDDDCDEDVPEAKSTSPQSRNGSVIVFRLEDGKARLLQSIPQPSAVFDLHFLPQQDHGDVFATVSSTGSISFFRLSPPANGTHEQDSPAIIATPLSTIRIPSLGEEVLFTYFTWHPAICGLMGITTASGDVLLVQIHDDYQGLSVLNRSVMQHDLEAWVLAFSPAVAAGSSLSSPVPYTLFSGGDDSALKYLTLNLPPTPLQKEEIQDDHDHDHYNDNDEDEDQEDQDLITPPFPPVTLKDHTAGVTAILPLSLPSLSNSTTTAAAAMTTPKITSNSKNPHLVLTGSYDDTIRLFAIHPLHATYGMRKANLLTEKNLGGGVWRLSVIGTPTVLPIVGNNHSSSSNSSSNTVQGREAEAEAAAEARVRWQVIILASCMHAGTRILQIQGTLTQDQAQEGEIKDITADEIEVLVRFEEHKSMNYGSDWSRVESSLVCEGAGSGSCTKGEQEREVMCVSTSFYDRLLCVWKCGIGYPGKER